MGSSPNSSKAVTALVLGILGLVVCSPLGIAAIVVGNQATREIAASGGREGGEGMAKAGVVLGWIAVALMALGLLLVVFLIVAGAMSSS